MVASWKIKEKTVALRGKSDNRTSDNSCSGASSGVAQLKVAEYSIFGTLSQKHVLKLHVVVRDASSMNALDSLKHSIYQPLALL